MRLQRCSDIEPAEFGPEVHRVEWPVMSDRNSTSQAFDHLTGDVLEGRGPPYIGSTDTVHRLGSEVALGVDQSAPLIGDVSRGIEVDNSDLCDPVVKAR